MTGGQAKGIRIIGWGDGGSATATATRAPYQQRPAGDENKQPKVVHAALHAAFRLLGPAQPASHLLPSHDPPSACAAAALGTTYAEADADAGSHAGAASSFRFRSLGPLAAQPPAAGRLARSHDLRAGWLAGDLPAWWGWAESPGHGGHGHHGGASRMQELVVHPHSCG